MNLVPEQPITRVRNHDQEHRERLRYTVLQGIYDRARGQCHVAVPGLEIGDALGLSREDTFRTVYDLTHRGYLFYRGAGPTVTLTGQAVAYLERGAGRRRSIRDG